MERVTFSQTREAPEDVLERLRAIDPAADLLFWGPRQAEVDVGGKSELVVVPVWLLGAVRPNGMRRRAGAMILNTQERLGARGDRDTWRYGKLLYQSFAPIAFYPFPQADVRIIEDFRLRDWLFRNQFETEEQNALLEAEGVPALELRKQQMIDKAQGEGPSLWKFAFGKRRSFLMS